MLKLFKSIKKWLKREKRNIRKMDREMDKIFAILDDF